jgi:hypothetical protein
LDLVVLLLGIVLAVKVCAGADPSDDNSNNETLAASHAIPPKFEADDVVDLLGVPRENATFR